MMLLHEKPPPHNGPTGITCEKAGDECGHPNQAEFDSYRVWTGFRPWRKSPRIPGLWLIKRAIVALRTRHLISVCFAQRLVDLSKCWEA
jgi:hypothetical protein